MAMNSSAGFATFAKREHVIQDCLSTSTPPPAPPTLMELRRERKAKKRQLRDLQSLSPDQIEICSTSISSQADDLKALEDLMREALGVGLPLAKKTEETLLGTIEFQPSASNSVPTPGVEQASETARKHAELEKELRASFGVPSPKLPEETTRKPSAPRTCVKRRLEVLLQVRRPDGSEIPFYHIDPCTSSIEAEINAGRKARGFGLTVLKTISTEVKEFEITVGGAGAFS